MIVIIGIEISGEQHWKYTYFKCEPQVRRDPLPRKKVKMPRKRPPKSVWDDEKTMYDIRPEISEEIMEIIQDSVESPRLTANSNRNRPFYSQKPSKIKPIHHKKYRNNHHHRHHQMLRSTLTRNKPPPEIHQSLRSNMRIKRGNPQTIMTFTI